jgi:hypothetical protein
MSDSLARQIDRITSLLAGQGVMCVEIPLAEGIELTWPKTEFAPAEYANEVLVAPCTSASLILGIWDLVQATRLLHVSIDEKRRVLCVECESLSFSSCSLIARRLRNGTGCGRLSAPL